MKLFDENGNRLYVFEYTENNQKMYGEGQRCYFTTPILPTPESVAKALEVYDKLMEEYDTAIKLLRNKIHANADRKLEMKMWEAECHNLPAYPDKFQTLKLLLNLTDLEANYEY